MFLTTPHPPPHPRIHTHTYTHTHLKSKQCKPSLISVSFTRRIPLENDGVVCSLFILVETSSLIQQQCEISRAYSLSITQISSLYLGIGIPQKVPSYTLIGLIFAVFADFCSIRENKYPRKTWNDINCKNKYPQKFEKETMIREYIYIFLTFTYKCNQIQLSQYLLLHDTVDPTCC